ncbi:MAG: hypothetical protein GF331_12315 [Chitinivibrionales bacterium]|nr:hypothetical protein [Chitinivibrionales bacterium]
MRQLRIEFDKTVRPWDGFGVNYVETAQTRDYDKDPQEYGGFSTLTDTQRAEILDLTFGGDGLKPGLVKLFLDPFHQPSPDGASMTIDDDAFDHETTTKWMRYFVREGLRMTRERGADLEMLTDLYGPPGWTTKQKILRGRDLDPKHETDVAKYIAAWVRYLRDTEGFPVAYAGFHNEGEDWVRWPDDGTDSPNHLGHDYNMYWSPDAVARFIPVLRQVLDHNGMRDVGVTPGETSNWTRFQMWGYADAIADSPKAVGSMGLITSHGFAGFGRGRWFADWRSTGIDTIQSIRPGMRAWVTSTSWSKMDVHFVWEVYNSIYCAKVNGIIPWACIQVPDRWYGGDPNPGCAFRLDGKGNYEVLPGYYFYKQVCRAGQRGMQVARTRSNESGVAAIAFTGGETDNPDAFVVLNLDDTTHDIDIEVCGSVAESFDSWRTSPEELYEPQGVQQVKDGKLSYRAPGGSVTTFYAQ